MIEKITLKLGNRRISLTQDEYDEMREHFKREFDQQPVYIPLPYPVYPQPINPPYWYHYPITTSSDPAIDNTEAMFVHTA